MASYRTDSEEEALFRSYPYALYFVQSPSSTTINPTSPLQALALSRYSSSRCSDTSFLKKHSSRDHDAPVAVLQSNHADGDCEVEGVGVNGDGTELCEYFYDDDGDERINKRGWTQYFSFGYSNSGWWILLQLSWRFLLSFVIALLVFYVAVKPPPPGMAIKVARIGQFRLGEGVDGSGVSTKILSCNCTLDVIIDNKSKLFDLHVHPPSVEMLFGHLPLAAEAGRSSQVVRAGSNGITILKVSVGTKNKAMYGGGREMADKLESGKGLGLQIRVGLRSSYHVVWGLGVFHPKFQHQAQCLMVLADKYDKKRRTQLYDTTCVVQLNPKH